MLACGEARAPDPGPEPSPPSIVLVTWDTVRADHVGAEPATGEGASGAAPSHTPTWDRLASEGLRFSEARTPVPITLPAHASLMSGLDPPQHGARDNGIFEVRAAVPLLAEELAGAGYETGAFVSAPVLDHRYGLERGFGLYDDLIPEVPGQRVVPMRRAEDTVSAALAWEQRVPDALPIFLWVHLFDPHREWVAPEPWSSRFDPYRAEIAYVDAQTGLLLDVLAARGRLQRSVVILTSDHGEGLGEHGELTHTYFAYDSTLRIPLLLWSGPDSGVEIAAGTTAAGPVSLVDIAPTLRAIAGLPARRSDGRSLAPFFDGRALPPRDLPVESVVPATGYGARPVFGVVTSQGEAWYDGAQRERYDLERDPAQLDNLYGEPDRERGDLLFARFARDWPPRDTTLDVDATSRSQLRELGYVVGTKPPDAPAAELVDARERFEVYEFLNRDKRRLPPEAQLAELDALEREHGVLPELAEYRVQLLDREGRARDALAALEAASAANPRHAQLRSTLQARRAAFEAARAHEKALRGPLEARPEDLATRRALATVLHQMQELKEAEVLYRQVLQAAPDDLDTAFNLGVVLIAAGRADEARVQLAALVAQAGHGARHACLAGQILALRLQQPEWGPGTLRDCEASGIALGDFERQLLSPPE